MKRKMGQGSSQDLPHRVVVERSVRPRHDEQHLPQSSEVLSVSVWTAHHHAAVLVPELPVTVVEEILLNVPAEQVVCVCVLVCKQWRSVVDSVSLWKKKCRREGFTPRHPLSSSRDWQLYYWLSKRRRNLLKNPKAEENYRGWDLVQNGGDNWHIEGIFAPHPDETVSKCFVTSYFPCIKRQLISLVTEGYSAKFLDEIQPDIIISDWYAPRRDCGSEYHICVELLNINKKPIHTFRPEIITFPQWNDQQWNQTTHVFRDYGPGVRYVRFTHGGKETQFWAGWYVIRVTNSSVEVYPAEQNRSESRPVMCLQSHDTHI